MKRYKIHVNRAAKTTNKTCPNKKYWLPPYTYCRLNPAPWDSTPLFLAIDPVRFAIDSGRFCHFVMDNLLNSLTFMSLISKGESLKMSCFVFYLNYLCVCLLHGRDVMCACSKADICACSKAEMCACSKTEMCACSKAEMCACSLTFS